MFLEDRDTNKKDVYILISSASINLNRLVTVLFIAIAY